MTLKLVAQYGDAANVGGGDPAVITDKLAILKRHCETVGRDYDQIIKSTNLNVLPLDAGDDPVTASEKARGGIGFEEFAANTVIGTDDQIAAQVDAALQAGADYIIFYVPGVAHDLDLVARAEAIARRFA